MNDDVDVTKMNTDTACLAVADSVCKYTPAETTSVCNIGWWEKTSGDKDECTGAGRNSVVA